MINQSDLDLRPRRSIEDPEVSRPKPWKISNLIITETEFPFIKEVSGVYTSLFLDTD